MLVDAFHEQVRIKGRHRDIGEHIAGGRLDGDHRAAPVTEGFFHDFLQFDIDRQDQVIAGIGRRARQGAHGAATSGDFNFFVAGDAMQMRFITFFQAFLADVTGAGIIRAIFHGFNARRIALRDAADVANHMRGDLAERILAKQPRLDFHAAKTVTLRREACHFFVGKARTDRRTFEIFCFFEQLAEALAVLGLDID